MPFSFCYQAPQKTGVRIDESKSLLLNILDVVSCMSVRFLVTSVDLPDMVYRERRGFTTTVFVVYIVCIKLTEGCMIREQTETGVSFPFLLFSFSPHFCHEPTRYLSLEL